jgi:1-deoxy-D-xylulose-5-phosphate reductoisomerase
MGAKITIDSATMANKALEIIEAHHLFGIDSEQIDVLVHPQSIVHGLVEFVDGSTIAQLGAPDMRTPIQLALTWPHRIDGSTTGFDLLALQQLDFEPPDPDRFPALSLARRVLSDGGTSGAIMNAANEAAVAAFLDRRIPFGRIAELTLDAMDEIPSTRPYSLDDIFAADRAARRCVEQRLDRIEVAP